MDIEQMRQLLEQAKAKTAPSAEYKPLRELNLSQSEKNIRDYLDAMNEARQRVIGDRVPTSLSDAASRAAGLLSGAGGAMVGYGAQIPGSLGDIASLYQTFKPESWGNLPAGVQALPTTEDIQDLLRERINASPEFSAGLTGGNVAAIGQGVAALPGLVKGVAKAIPRIAEEALVPRIGPRGQMGAITYHGSPHRFAPTERNPLGEFDPTKIGTGEGAQAYGHGYYLAEQKDVGKSYQPRSPDYEEKLIKKYNLAQSSERYPEMEILEDAMLHNTPDEILKKYTAGEYTPEHIKAAKDFAKWAKKNPPEVGGLYTVDLPDEQIAKMLDWDKPLSQQSEAVKKMLPEYSNLDWPITKLQGRIRLSDGTLADSEQQLSQALKERGIPGIRYLDQGSRGTGEGTRNYVVFPGGESMLNIIKREKKGGQVNADAMNMAAWDKQVQHKQVGGITKAAKALKALTAGRTAEELADIGKAIKPVEMRQELSKAGTPLVFERVPPKSKEEIRAIAERMAPQVLGEFVKKPGETYSVAGKSKKVFERQKELPVEMEATKELPPSQIVDYQNLGGNVMVGLAGDPSEVNKILRAIGNVRLKQGVQLYGGPRYGQGRDEFWASELAAASGLQSLAKRAQIGYDAPAIGSYIRMPEGMDYAMHNLDALLSVQQPEKLSPGKLAQLNNVIKRGSLDYGKFPDFVGFEDPELVLLQAQINPKLRKQISSILTKPTYTEKFGLFSGEDIKNAISVPELRDVETGVTGFSIGRLKPDQPLSESLHPTYAKDIPGEYMGHTKYPIPYELSFPDVTKYATEQSALKGSQPFGQFKMTGPRQIVDQQLIDEIKQYEEMMKSLTGKKKGGKVQKKAEGGITSDDLILEERKL